MVGLKNKEFIKLMWLPGEKEILLHMKDEKPVPISHQLYRRVSVHIDIEEWKNIYKLAYDNWLNKDDSSIYNINHDINFRMIMALQRTNETAADVVVFYWFDIDRTFNERFIWEYCPISQKKLIHLGLKYPKINSLISPDYPIVFPSN